MSRRDDESRDFLEAIRDSPDDDTHRLVYADWLEDHDDPARADFIRVQCELARMTDESRRPGLEARERELLAANRGTWLGPLDRVLQFDQCTFRRGFPDDLTIRPSTIVKLAEEFDARVPAGRVTLYGGFGDPAIRALAACPTLGWVAALMYEHPRVTEAGLEMIGNSPNLTRLEELSVNFADFTTTGLIALTTSPHRAGLRRLSLHRFSWRGMTHLDTAAAFVAPGVRMRLRALSLQGHQLGAGGAATLAGTPNLADVKQLDLTLNNLNDEGALALARSPHLNGLTGLTLQTNGMTSRSVRELADSPLLDGIRVLNLGVNDVGDAGAEALAASARLCSLRTLSLFSAAITDRGAAALAASPHLSNLTELHLSGSNSLTDRGSQSLFDSPHLRGLRCISLTRAPQRGSNLPDQRKQWRARLGPEARV